MIKLTSLISEGKTKLAYRNGSVEFNTSFKNGKLVLIPKTSKDLDAIKAIKSKLGSGSGEDFLTLTKIRLQQKTGFGFKVDSSYGGAGYAFEIDDNSILKMLEVVTDNIKLEYILPKK
jgi:hypothetical protein